jgi:hypothetical protein
MNTAEPQALDDPLETCAECDGQITRPAYEDHWGNLFCSLRCQHCYERDVLGLEADHDA